MPRRPNQTDEERIKNLRNILRHHSYLYHWLDSPEVSDYQYDMWYKELKELEEKHPELDDPNSPTKNIGFFLE